MVAECSRTQKDISELKDGDDAIFRNFWGKYRKSRELLFFFFLHVCHFWPGLGLPRPKAIVVITKNSTLAKTFTEKNE